VGRSLRCFRLPSTYHEMSLTTEVSLVIVEFCGAIYSNNNAKLTMCLALSPLSHTFSKITYYHFYLIIIIICYVVFIAFNITHSGILPLNLP